MTAFSLLIIYLAVILGDESTCSAWSIRYNSQGQPRLCSIVAASLNGFTRIGSGFAPLETSKIVVTAGKNREVLQGKFQQILIEVKTASDDTRRKRLISFGELTAKGNNLDIGYTPFLSFTVLPLAFILASPSLILLLFFTWRMLLKLQQQKQIDPLNWKTILGGKPCHFDYILTLNNSNIAGSPLMKVLAKSLLQSFMSTSVLPLAAAAGDATKLMLQDDTAKAASSSSALDIWKENQQSSSFELSNLLSATSFELRDDLSFEGDGFVLLPCVAVLPDNKQSQQSRLDFTLRTKMTARNTNDFFSQTIPEIENTNGLLFSSPDCRVDVDAAIPKDASKWTKRLFPSVVWLPIGSAGMILPTPKGISIKRVLIKTGTCRLHGQVKLFHEKAENQSRGWNRIFKRLQPSKDDAGLSNRRLRLKGSKGK